MASKITMEAKPTKPATAYMMDGEIGTSAVIAFAVVVRGMWAFCHVSHQ
jgi:hypothetical protein